VGLTTPFLFPGDPANAAIATDVRNVYHVHATAAILFVFNPIYSATLPQTSALPCPA
jgi:hypothetical protein